MILLYPVCFFTGNHVRPVGKQCLSGRFLSNEVPVFRPVGLSRYICRLKSTDMPAEVDGCVGLSRQVHGHTVRGLGNGLLQFDNPLSGPSVRHFMPRHCLLGCCRAWISVYGGFDVCD